MGRGRSGLKSGGGSRKPAPAPAQAQAPVPSANTPSGISYDQFMAMPDAQKYQVMEDVIGNSSIAVPSYLDNSITTKVMYALGMDNKPTVVPDAQIDSMPGRDLYRTVYESGSMPPPSSADVLDQIRNGDYTQMSGAGGSVHGRAIYFAEGNFGNSAAYGQGERNPLIMRAKINSNANIVTKGDLLSRMARDQAFVSSNLYSTRYDNMALYALSHGIDGWREPNIGYAMIVNRGVLTASSQNKSINTTSRITGRKTYARSWKSAPNA